MAAIHLALRWSAAYSWQSYREPTRAQSNAFNGFPVVIRPETKEGRSSARVGRTTLDLWQAALPAASATPELFQVESSTITSGSEREPAASGSRAAVHVEKEPHRSILRARRSHRKVGRSAVAFCRFLVLDDHGAHATRCSVTLRLDRIAAAGSPPVSPLPGRYKTDPSEVRYFRFQWLRRFWSLL